ncbi:MAG: hypothetical protein Q7T11_07665, partial [Deltaproteobacteria bacterium]|nr:hypothetical protein [Deltaproteobacteria bacterium]
YAFLEKGLEEQVRVSRMSPENFSTEGLDALMIVEPKDVSTGQAKIEKAFKEGMPVILLAGRVSVQPSLAASSYATGLEEWLSSLGITLSSEILADLRSNASAAFSSGSMQYLLPYPFFAKIPQEGFNSSHAVTSQLEGVVLPWTNVLKLQEEGKFEILAESSSGGILRDPVPAVGPDTLEGIEPDQVDKQVLAVLKQHLLVIPNHYFVQNNFLRDNPANIVFIQNVVDNALWGNKLTGIRSRGKSDNPVTLPSPAGIAAIRWGHMIGIPLMVIAVGFLIYALRRRRHRQIAAAYANV